MGLSKGTSAAETKERLLTESRHNIPEKERTAMSENENKTLAPKLAETLKDIWNNFCLAAGAALWANGGEDLA